MKERERFIQHNHLGDYYYMFWNSKELESKYSKHHILAIAWGGGSFEAVKFTIKTRETEGGYIILATTRSTGEDYII